MEDLTKDLETGFITELDRYLYNNGRHYEIYEKLGAHPKTYNGKQGMYFAVWAPHASQVGVVGDFNGWNPDLNPMVPLADSGIWEVFVPEVGPGQLYKYSVTTSSGKILFKADPYAFYAEFRPQTASITYDLSAYPWKDQAWVKEREKQDPLSGPVSIYEVHLGSWKRKNREDKEGFYTYKEAAHELAEYIKDMGYTHIELLGIAEHPYDGSWGYQVTGYYAPTSRYGTPDEFMYFVDTMHQNGIGVILDWVPAHFPKDAHGLSEFDGEACYEYADPRKGEHPDWGTKVFDYSKYEVCNFLIANALYWVEKYHVDGLRVDAVASMLYLDYGRDQGDWVKNCCGGNENLEAIEFFKHLNSMVKKRGKGAVVIAEESTAWPKVTDQPENSGLGFTFKWNMGWMHDFLEYMKLDPYFRKYNHHKMTFGLTYFTSEKYILVLSHDEVVHLKGSMINKMPGLLEDKFSNLKLGYTFMLGHPGKKLLFMGQDFGQFHEWDEKDSLDWYLAREPLGENLLDYVRDLLHLYRKYPALYDNDYVWEGFSWINANDNEHSIFSFIRHGKGSQNSLLFVLNFTPVKRPEYRVGVPKQGKYTLVLDTSHGLYEKDKTALVYKSEKTPWDGQDNSIAYPLPAYGAAIFCF
ncbi:1,4-alpha-glucan branching protein GlgB [Lacrimispora amygdalina]|uniref:1,4-alpha-glucan branching enzyme GlgB n=1 Tax=Lacrimispora amygdalina TaxID=253257 RepID=A0A3E2N7U9_9FIRM|nr:1,4-alpha-glucan branching protein GlgB [Clostridium indicum]RFZ77032.1 1,4-alpha-glucan branching protein GlgB [Clostridium indicum]